MAKKKEDGFYNSAKSFFKRLQNQDLIRVGDNKITTLDQPEGRDERSRRSEFSVFRQYLQQKNWSTKHIELFNEYRKMDDSFPIINAALRLYTQEVCLTGDTILHTPVGDKTIFELYNSGKNKTMFYVHTVDMQYKRTQWGMAKYIKYNGKKTVYEVVVERNLDEDTDLVDKIKVAKFKCTDNHKLMIHDGTFKMLSELSPGDSLFSFYKWTDPECRCKVDKFQTSKILSISEAGEEDVYDLVNVEPFSHFSIKLTDTMYVQVHNCSKDEEGNIIKIHSEDKEIKKSLEDLFFRTLKINSQGILLSKEMLKFGNLYCFLNVRKGEGVTDIIHLPPEAIRIELVPNSSSLDDFKYTWFGQGGGGAKFEPWEIVHWRNIEDIEMQPYGTSILRSIVDTWRRIILMREALIIYRITRAPQRYLFKIDTTGMDPDAALLFSEEVKKQLYKKPMVNPFTGEIDFKYNPLSIEENFYMPTFEGDVGGIDTLQGASNLSDVEDYKIIKDDLFAGLLIPKSYLTFEEDLCLKGDTDVLTNNGTISIKELADNWEKGQKLFVLSCNKYGYITPGKVLWVKETKKTNTLYKTEINGTHFEETTENHPYLMADLTYKRADELQVGDKLKGMYEKEYTVTATEVLTYATPESVYDLEVEEFHNFALASNVFVHNSNKAALAQEDMRFAGAVKQYQGNFIEGLLHIALVHLNSQGFSKSDLEKFEIQMNTNSQLVKKMENEALQQEVDLAKSILDVSNGELTLMSFTDVMRKVMHFSDEEIKATIEQQLVEKKLAWKFSQIKENGFYTEPEESKKEELANRLGDEDVFSKLQFEAVKKDERFGKLLKERIKDEIAALMRPIKLSPTKAQIGKIVDLNPTKTEMEQVKKDLDLND